MLPPIVGVLFDGLAYGMLLFLLSVGQSVTLGMMNFINLAHCSFAMLGGYITVALMSRYGWPFFATLPCAFIVAALVSVAFERTLFRRLYRAGELDQVLLTIGLVFMSVAVAAYVFGTDQQPLQLPGYLRSSITFMGIRFAVCLLYTSTTRSFDDAIGSSNCGGDASVPSRLSETRSNTRTRSLASIPAAGSEQELTRSRNGKVKSYPAWLVLTGGAAKPPPSGPPIIASCASCSAMFF